jgi:hypothetical protein
MELDQRDESGTFGLSMLRFLGSALTSARARIDPQISRLPGLRSVTLAGERNARPTAGLAVARPGRVQTSQTARATSARVVSSVESSLAPAPLPDSSAPCG